MRIKTRSHFPKQAVLFKKHKIKILFNANKVLNMTNANSSFSRVKSTLTLIFNSCFILQIGENRVDNQSSVKGKEKKTSYPSK